LKFCLFYFIWNFFFSYFSKFNRHSKSRDQTLWSDLCYIIGVADTSFAFRFSPVVLPKSDEVNVALNKPAEGSTPYNGYL